MEHKHVKNASSKGGLTHDESIDERVIHSNSEGGNDPKCSLNQWPPSANFSVC